MSDEFNAIVYEQPRSALSVVENQRRFQWVNNNEFYTMIPAPYFTFYQNWVRLWLQWADGYVPFIHGGQYGLLSSGIGGSLITLATDKVIGSGVMYKNSRKPKEIALNEKGKPIGKALDFISNSWADKTDLEVKYRRAIKYAYAGGFSLLKANINAGEVWVDVLRADRFWLDVTSDGQIRRSVCALNFYNPMTPQNQGGKKYGLVEERYYAKIGLFEKEIPVVEYKIYDSTVPIQYMTMPHGNFIPWEELPKDVRKAFKSEYGNMRLNEPQALNGFENLGVFLVKDSDEVTNVPQINLGESLLAPVLTSLYEYDHYNTAFNTDIYLGRGRVLVPKFMQNKQGTGSQPTGFDDFLFTKNPSINPEEQQPQPVQFELRSQDWKEIRNHIIENIASGLRMSATSIATYLQGGAQRTAREVSAEEDETTLFVENARKRFTKPFNDLLRLVLRFYGFIDDVEIRWSRAGMTNQTVLVETLSRAVEAGLISRFKAHAQFNYDDDEEQQLEDYQRVEEDRAVQEPNYSDFYEVGDKNDSEGDAQPAGESA